MNEKDVEKGKTVISKFASESTISKNRHRLENVSVRKHDSLLFDLPMFSHSEKSNLPKVLSTIGTVHESLKFDGRSESGKKYAVINFEKIDIISKKMEKHILLGNLVEKQAVSVFQLYFTQRIIDEVSSYCITDWKDLTYQQILSTLQFLYMPLNLSLFQSLVLAYRVEVNESFFGILKQNI